MNITLNKKLFQIIGILLYLTIMIMGNYFLYEYGSYSTLRKLTDSVSLPCWLSSNFVFIMMVLGTVLDILTLLCVIIWLCVDGGNYIKITWK